MGYAFVCDIWSVEAIKPVNIAEREISNVAWVLSFDPGLMYKLIN